MNAFTAAFLAALALALVARLWLASRQVRHVTANRDRVPEQFAQTIPLAAHQKAADYTVARTRVGQWETLVDAAWLLLLTLGGLLGRLYAVSAPLAHWPLTRDVAFIAMVALAGGIVSLPFSLYMTFVIEERFGFNRMTLRLWLLDLVKGLAVAAAFGLPLLYAVLWTARAAGDLWWLWAWAVWVVFQLLVLVLYPTLIAPLFNKFEPLADESVRERVERLLRRCGFRSRGLFVMDGSRRSSHGNAYFTGLGAAKRIVFFDTLLRRLSPPEVEAVLAHELGHFKLRHVAKRMLLAFAVSLGLLAVLAWLAAQPWFYAGLGFAVDAGPPSLGVAFVLFFLALPVFAFLLAPLAAIYSRRHEFEADRYAAEHARAADLVRALVKLYEDNASTLTPDPIHSAFYDSHPPAATRVRRLLAH